MSKLFDVGLSLHQGGKDQARLEASKVDWPEVPVLPLLKSCLAELGFDHRSARGAEEPKPSKPTWAEKAGGPWWTNKACSVGIVVRWMGSMSRMQSRNSGFWKLFCSIVA